MGKAIRFKIVLSEDLPFARQLSQLTQVVDVEAYEQAMSIQRKLNMLCDGVTAYAFMISGDFEEDVYFTYCNDFILYFSVFESFIVPMWFYRV